MRRLHFPVASCLVVKIVSVTADISGIFSILILFYFPPGLILEREEKEKKMSQEEGKKEEESTTVAASPLSPANDHIKTWQFSESAVLALRDHVSDEKLLEDFKGYGFETSNHFFSVMDAGAAKPWDRQRNDIRKHFQYSDLKRVAVYIFKEPEIPHWLLFRDEKSTEPSM
jgi:hypothetical protein